jgi:hypothetical protein
MEVSCQLHTPAALPPGERAPGTHWLGGPQSRSGRCGVEKILALPGIEPWPSSPSLYRLSYPGSIHVSYINMLITHMLLLPALITTRLDLFVSLSLLLIIRFPLFLYFIIYIYILCQCSVSFHPVVLLIPVTA